MVFNGDANNMDLCTLSDDLLGGTDDVEFPLREKALYANWALREIFKVILDVYGGWTIQDSNVSGIDKATVDLLADGTQFYAFASVSWISAVAFKDDNDIVEPLTPITLQEIHDMGYAEDDFEDTPGRPKYYRMVKNGIKIYPAWDTSKSTVTNGLIVNIGAQDINAFTPASTSTSPGYDSLAGHEVVAVGMAYRKSKVGPLQSMPGLSEDWYNGLASIRNFYKKKAMQLQQVMKSGSSRNGGGYVDNFV